jgi:AcrR family transcriptional regulator
VAKGSQPNKRSGTPKGDGRKVEIVDAAISLFAEEGYRGASLAAIADTVGLTQPGLLHHFPSKEDLLLAVLDERDLRDESEMNAAFANGQDVFTALEDLVEHNAMSRDTVRLFTVLVGESAVSDTHPGHQHFSERYRHVLDVTRSRLERAAETGEIAADTDCTLVARLLLAAMDGLQIQWLFDPELDMREAFRVLSAVLEAAAVRGLSGTETPTLE